MSSKKHIYVATTETYHKEGLVKIGETTQKDPMIRIKQIPVPEVPILLHHEEASRINAQGQKEYFNDHEVHKAMKELNIERRRGEWFCDPDHKFMDAIDMVKFRCQQAPLNQPKNIIFTPVAVADALLKQCDATTFSNRNARFLCPFSKSGTIVKELFHNLNFGLRNTIPNEIERKIHILRDMIYVIPVSEEAAILSRKALYGSNDASSEEAIRYMGAQVFNEKESNGRVFYAPSSHTWEKGCCVHCGVNIADEKDNPAIPFLHENIGNITNMKKFDYIIGNPPYQRTTASVSPPLYHLFVNKAKEIADEIIMITPSRWFTGGLGLDDFREVMLNDKGLSKMVHHPDAKEVFPDVSIAGGISYWHWSRNHNSDYCEFTIKKKGTSHTSIIKMNEYDEGLIWEPENRSILDKVKAANITDEWLVDKISPVRPYGLESNFRDFSATNNGNQVAVYCERGTVGYVDHSKVPVTNSKYYNMIYRRKVLVPKTGDAHLADKKRRVISEPFIAESPSCCTMTFLVASDNSIAEHDMENYVKFLKTKFVRYLIGMFANTQNVTKGRYKRVPALPMNRIWTDADLYAWANLSKDEIDIIEYRIIEMD